MKQLKDVSLLITCFNKLAYLPALISQLEETKNQGPEVLIIDDFSDDGSREKLISIAHNFSNVTLLLNERNFGSAFSRNKLLENAKRRWVFFWDIDDQIDFFALGEMIKQADKEGVDICRGTYSLLNSNLVINDSSPIPKNQVHKLSDFAVEIAEGMGFWRFLYSNKFLRNNHIIFLPSLKDLNSTFFILDDVFFLLLIASTEGKMSIATVPVPVYRYNRPIQNQLSWSRFQKQACLFPKASLLCLDYARRIGVFKLSILLPLLVNKSRAHVGYLRITQWKMSIRPFLGLLFERELNLTLSTKISLVSSSLWQSIKNSLVVYLYKDSS